MRVGVKREFPQRRSRKYRPSSVTSVRTGASFPRGGSQEVVRPVPVLRARSLPNHTGCSVPLASPERGGGPRSGGGVFRHGYADAAVVAVGHGLPAVPPKTHSLRWFRRSAVYDCGSSGRPSPTGWGAVAPKLCFPKKGGGGVFRRAGSSKRTPQSRYARQLPLKGEPRTGDAE